MKKRKGIILAGGTGTRLYPITLSISKQLLPIYNKPMIYYPLSVLMMTGIKEILIITTPQDLVHYKKLLGDGGDWGISLHFITQPSPDGLAQAFILGEEFLDGSPSALILGDNIFYGSGLSKILSEANETEVGAEVFGIHVNDPERYGVIDFNKKGTVKGIVEKPKKKISNYAVTGLYFVDETAPKRAKQIKPSKRKEIEITSLLENYLNEEKLKVRIMNRGFTWLDTGTYSSLLDASNFVRTITERQGLEVGSPDEIAFQNKWINKAKLVKNSKKFGTNQYGKYLRSLVHC